MRKLRSKMDPSANLFAIAVDAQGNEYGVGRVETIASLRHLIIENMQSGLFTEIAILNLRQLESVVRRIGG